MGTLVESNLGHSISKLAPHAKPVVRNDTQEARVKRNMAVFQKFAKNKDGALKMTSEEEIARQRGVVWELVKTVGNSLMEGRELTNLTLPVTLFEPSSFLEKMSQSWLMAPTYLTKAALTKDPVERMKLVVTFLVAGIHFAPAERKPFNPILGETFEASFDDGSTVFCEQISHHPPKSAFQVVGPNNCYLFSGYGKTSASARGNTIKGYQEGPNCVEFADGTKITFTLPVLNISGVLWGERTLHYEGGITFTDEKHRLHAEVVFNPDAQGFLKSLFKKQKTGVDVVRGQITRIGEKTPLATLDGSWLSHLEWDGERVWELERDLPHLQHRPENALPSDCRFREDLQALAKGDLAEGAECKQMLEERQRYDAKLRQAFKPAKHRATLSAKDKEAKPVYKDVAAPPADDHDHSLATSSKDKKKKDKKKS